MILCPFPSRLGPSFVSWPGLLLPGVLPLPRHSSSRPVNTQDYSWLHLEWGRKRLLALAYYASAVSVLTRAPGHHFSRVWLKYVPTARLCRQMALCVLLQGCGSSVASGKVSKLVCSSSQSDSHPGPSNP